MDLADLMEMAERDGGIRKKEQKMIFNGNEYVCDEQSVLHLD